MAECGEDKNNAVVICIFRVHLENDQGGGGVRAVSKGGLGTYSPGKYFCFSDALS